MAPRFEVSCINKIPRDNIYERIQKIGGKAGGGWTLSVAEVIDRIIAQREEFYVNRPRGDVVDIEVAISRFGNHYIKTTVDGDEPNNLLSLPECPR
ncbi:hypothetical protein GGR25_002763 [Kaistia hirudinis]|uniref:DUF3892 domain-containing protein n=1 Tax=Kaistia hirudinis TaxID=1293440 RepID=A0A840AR24_9HYPH|nr:DUF3892 domain-containing protein [Kaistia hirudinis]MBB3931713.1 hypothetical protein [Kaistia hirudinis]